MMQKMLKTKDFGKPLAYITQTTLSVDDTEEIINHSLKKNFLKLKALSKKIFVMQLQTDSQL